MKKKLFTLCAFHLLVAIVAAILIHAIPLVADEYAGVIQKTINTNAAVVWTNFNQGAQTYPSAYMFNFNPSGTYTVQVDLVKGTYTNRLVRQVITSGTMGTFLPENRIWISGGDIVRITMPQASPTVTNQTQIILSKDEDR